jgi:hypothetical protein
MKLDKNSVTMTYSVIMKPAADNLLFGRAATQHATHANVTHFLCALRQVAA